MEFIFSKHCIEQINRRGIAKQEVLDVLQQPDATQKLDDEIVVYQALLKDRKHLLRIFVNVLKQPKMIVTAYKTSKIQKYNED